MSGLEAISVELAVGEQESEAQAVESALRAAGASDIDRKQGPEGILPVVMIVVEAVVGVDALADLIMRWRKGHMCQEIIDAREKPLKREKDCSIRDGRIIVIASDKQKVEIHDVPDSFDLTKVIEAAIKSGGEAVKAAAEAAGGKATQPRPDDTTRTLGPPS